MTNNNISIGCYEVVQYIVKYADVEISFYTEEDALECVKRNRENFISMIKIERAVIDFDDWI